MNRVDPIIHRIVQSFGNKYFTKPKAMNEICSDTRISNILNRLPNQYLGWNLDQIFKKFIESRLTTYLQKTDNLSTLQGKLKIRVYECYAVGEGPRRWQLLKGMSANDLRICIRARRVQVAGHNRVIKVYETLLELLDGLGSTAKVADVYEQSLEKLEVELASALKGNN